MKHRIPLILAALAIALVADWTTVVGQRRGTTVIPTSMDRSQLGDSALWRDVVVTRGVPWLSVVKDLTPVKAKTVVYRMPQGSIDVAAISDPISHSVYFVRGGQTFYLPYKGDMLSCIVGSGGFVWVKSYFSVPSTKQGASDAIRRFAAEVSDAQIVQREASEGVVDLHPGVPFQFFTANSLGGSQGVAPTVIGIELTGHELQLRTRSSGGKYTGTFWIDLEAAQVRRSVVDGKEVYPSGGSQDVITFPPRK